MSPAPRWQQRSAIVFAIFLIAGPVHSIIHECAHVTAARRFGWMVQLSWKATHLDAAVKREWDASVREGSRGPAFEQLRRQRAQFLAAGLAANAATSLVGLAALGLLRRFRPAHPLVADVGTAAGAVLATSGVLLILAGVQTTGYSDLERLSSTLDTSLMNLRVSSAGIGLATSVAAILLVRIKEWRHFIPAALAGGWAGYVLWDDVLGPWLLP